MYLYNDLRICCDWLEFTIQEKSPYVVLEQLGFTSDLFRKMDRGSMGYSGMLRHKSAEITILHNGNDDMGVHVQVKGSAVSYFLEMFKNTLKSKDLTPWMTEVFEYDDFDDVDNLIRVLFIKVRSAGWFSRIDLAIDDVGANYYTCKKVHDVLKNGNYVSKIKKWQADVTYNRQGDITGYTVYLGSARNSRMFLRVYDKRLEQLAKKGKTELPDWVRWEIVLKDERAENFAAYIVNNMDFSVATASVLNSLVRFVKNDSCNKSLCTTKSKWKKFVGAVEKIKLTSLPGGKSVQKSYDWICRQCAPTLAGLTAAFGGDMSFITKNLSEHFERLSAKDREMFLNYYLKGDDENVDS